MKDLQSYKWDKHNQLKYDYVTSINTIDITVGYKTYTICGGIEVLQLLNLGLDSAKYTQSINVKFRDCFNTLYEIPINDYELMINELTVKGNSLWEKKVDLQEQLSNATTIEEVENINW